MDASSEGKIPRNITNVQVVVRCRPASADERARGMTETVHCDRIGNEVRVAVNKIEKVFSYDRVYDPHSSQREIYEDVVEPLVQQTLRGYNTTVLAYGQTGTGKTHTMEGDIEDPESMGVIPRAMQSIFRTLDSRGDTESYVKASYLEIYNENLTDLLSTNNAADVPATQQLRIVEDKTKTGKGVVVHNQEEVLVKSWEDIRKVMKLAMSKRKVASTDLNDRSSRSHAVFTVTVHCKEFSPEGEELLRVGKINLVDLAGSENVARSGSKDVRAREAGNINQSLLTLGRVITALVEKSPHIAYRDSKLTRLLQESLGGCSLTLMIATVAPSVHCLDETFSTLEYASRAKAIKNKPMANQKMTKRVAIREYVEEIERLRLELQAARTKDGVYLPEDQYNQLLAQSKSTSIRVQDLEALMEKKQGELTDLRTMFSHTNAELKRTSAELDLERDRLVRNKEELRRRESELEEERKQCEERQALVDAHVSTESRLLLVHDQLQERLKNAKDRLGGLHDKVDRKNALERENERLVVDVKREIERRSLEVEQALREGNSVASERLNKVSAWLERLRKFVSEDVHESAATHRQRASEAFAALHDRTQSASSDWTQAQVIRIEREATSNVSSLKEAATLFSEGCNSHEDVLISATHASRTESALLRAETLAPLLEEVENARQSAQSFAESLSVAFLGLQGAVHALEASYEAKLAEMEAQMQRMVQAEKLRSRKATETAKEKMSFLLASLAEDAEYEMDRMMDQTKHARSTVLKHVQKEFQDLDASMSMVHASNEHWFGSEDDRIRQAIRNARTNENLARSQSDTMWQDVNERSEAAVLILRKGASEAGSALSRVERESLIALQETQERSERLASELRTAKASWQEVARAGMEESSEMKDRAGQLIVQTKRDLDFAHEHVETVSLSSIGALEDSREGVVGKFHLREDRPTGRTPSRLQVFEWTKERPQTSPHSRIVERIRKSRSLLSSSILASTPLIFSDEAGPGGVRTASKPQSKTVEEVDDALQARSTSGKPLKTVQDIEDAMAQQSNSASALKIAVKQPSVSKSTLSKTRSSSASSSENRDGNHVEINEEMDALKFNELRSVLKEKGLSVKGDKAALKQRLLLASQGESSMEAEDVN